MILIKQGYHKNGEKFTCFGLDFCQVQVSQSKTAPCRSDPEISPFSVSSQAVRVLLVKVAGETKDFPVCLRPFPC